MDVMTTLVTVLTCLVGLGVGVLLSLIPWAFVVQGRLARIEAACEIAVALAPLVQDLLKRVTILETMGLRDRNEH